MEKIDKWCAEQCGVELNKKGFILNCSKTYLNPITDEKGTSFVWWTIQDPRCREIVREKYLIDTDVQNDGWIAQTILGYGLSEAKTIAEVEIACIIAIYEAEHEN